MTKQKYPTGRECKICGGPIRGNNKAGICKKNPECSKARHIPSDKWGVCDVCGKRLRVDNRYGCCSSHPEYFKRARNADPAHTREVRARLQRKRLAIKSRLPHASYDTAQMYHDQKGLCSIGGEFMPNRSDIHVEHTIPVSKGGWTVPANLTLACSYHNVQKHNTMPANAEAVAEQQFRWWLSERFVPAYCAAIANSREL